jgi:hypothetical protein
MSNVMFKICKTKASVLNPRAFGLSLIVLFFGTAFCSACSSTKPLLTTSINFRCDSNYNDGFILPLDIVYISDGEKIDTVTAVSPDEWFDSKVREEWPNVETLSFTETGVRNTLKVELKKTKQTVKAIIIADYRSLTDAKTQTVVLDAESKENEDVFITINGLLH